MNVFARKIKILRLAQGFSQRELGYKLKLKETTVWNWEREGALPRPKTIPKLSVLLECDASELARLWVEASIDKINKKGG